MLLWHHSILHCLSLQHARPTLIKKQAHGCLSWPKMPQPVKAFKGPHTLPSLPPWTGRLPRPQDKLCPPNFTNVLMLKICLKCLLLSSSSFQILSTLQSPAQVPCQSYSRAFSLPGTSWPAYSRFAQCDSALNCHLTVTCDCSLQTST